MNRNLDSREVMILVMESYLARIRNAVGTRMFRTIYALVNGKKQDILRRGDLSCAQFVSSVLLGFSLIKSMHVTVDGTIHDMRASGWERIRKPKVGCVVVWESIIDRKGEPHKHIGFYLGHGKAISNNSGKGYPHIHPYRVHKVDELYWHASLK